MNKGVSPMVTVAVAIIVAIVSISVGIYAYLSYNQLVTSGGGVTTTTTTPAGSGKILLKYDNSTKTVYLILDTSTTGPQFNFNKTTNGNLIIYVPNGFQLNIKYINYQSLTHNVVIIKNSTAGPFTQTDVSKIGQIIAIVGADQNNYLFQGPTNGQSATGVTPPLQSGIYIIACGISGHAASGMWAVLVVGNVQEPYAIIKS
jgi:sulfocyanin